MANSKKPESTGTARGGTSWSHPLPTETEDGARIVYVAVPNEDTLALTQAHWARKMAQEPRISALNIVVSARQFAFKGNQNVEAIIIDAAKVEQYILNGTVPDLPVDDSGDDD